MDLSETMFKHFANAFSLSVQLCRKEQILFSCQKYQISPNLARYYLLPYIGGTNPVGYVVTPDMIYSGYIAVPDSEDYFLVGPAILTELSATQIDRMLVSVGLPKSRLFEVTRYFFYVPQMTVDSFVSMLEFLSMLIRPGYTETPVQFNYALPENRHNIRHELSLEQLMNRTSEDTLKKMVTYGQTDAVADYFSKLVSDYAASSDIPKIGPTVIRSLKNTFVASTAIISRYAVDGGVNYQEAMNLSDYYINHAERLEKYADIMELFIRMARDFTRRVELHLRPEGSSATVHAIYRIIQAHRYEKLSTGDIAGYLSLSSGYLCRHFKEQTGMTLTQYISEQKINEAKYLLTSTSMSLSDIALKLGYSSQQQFQAAFKKISGVTPNQFRSEQLSEAGRT